MLTYQKSSSMIKPEEVDDTSSQFVTYLHRNVEEKTDENDNVYYEYDECKLTKAEYQAYLLEKQRADIDYIALMSDIDLEEA